MSKGNAGIMYAIVRTGGKQYRIEEQGMITVDKLAGEAGESVTINEVLFVGGTDSPQWGKPTVSGATVNATIVDQVKGPKIDGFNYKPKQNIRKHWGHRQQLTRLRIESISL
jgi:large subunit ribosomal protein L21